MNNRGPCVRRRLIASAVGLATVSIAVGGATGASSGSGVQWGRVTVINDAISEGPAPGAGGQSGGRTTGDAAMQIASNDGPVQGAQQYAADSMPGGTPAADLVADASYAQFDPGILKERGLDASLNQYFARAPRFTPGDDVVQVTLNGNALGRRNVTFGDQGQLCFTPAFLSSIGLQPMAGAPGEGNDAAAHKTAGELATDALVRSSALAPQPSGAGGAKGQAAVVTAQMSCPDYRDVAPSTIVQLSPSTGSVDITVPPEFVSLVRSREMEHGGTAGLFNYRFFDFESGLSGRGTRNSFRQLDSMLGFNTDDWIVRTHQYLTDTGSRTQFQLQEAYAQKTFVNLAQTLQVGRTFTQTSLFSGIAFAGAQWFPESALAPTAGYVVSGVASSRARVEVRQNGMLLYTTVVPPGPFSLTQVPIRNTSADLQVRVVEDSGAEQDFVVPSSSLLLAANNAPPVGLSVAAGRLWDPGDTGGVKAVPFASAANGWSLIDGRVSGVAAGLAARNYASVGGGLNTQLFGVGQSFYIQGLVARDTAHNQNGVSGSAAISFNPNPWFQYGFSGTVNSLGYRSVQEAENYYAQYGDIYGYRTQVGATASLNTGVIGAFTAGITRQTYHHGDAGYIATVGWNVSIGRAQLAIGGSYNTSRSAQYAAQNAQNTLPLNQLISSGANPATFSVPSSNYLFANLTIPLGHGITSNSFFHQTHDTGQSTGVVSTGIDQRLSDTLGYSATVQKDPRANGQPDTTLTAYATPRYTSVTLGLDNGEYSRSVYGELSGGVVVTGGGVAFSPQEIQDTFAIVKTGNVPGIRLDTPQGPTWSGLGGLTAVSSLLPFHDSRIEVAGDSLPANVDVDNGLQVVQASRGAVLNMVMGATRVHRVLLEVTMNGAPVASGLPVLRVQPKPAGGATGAQKSTTESKPAMASAGTPVDTDTAPDGEFFTTTLPGGQVMVTDLREGEALRVQLPGGRVCTLKDFALKPARNGEQFERGSAHCE